MLHSSGAHRKPLISQSVFESYHQLLQYQKTSEVFHVFIITELLQQWKMLLSLFQRSDIKTQLLRFAEQRSDPVSPNSHVTQEMEELEEQSQEKSVLHTMVNATMMVRQGWVNRSVARLYFAWEKKKKVSSVFSMMSSEHNIL